MTRGQLIGGWRAALYDLPLPGNLARRVARKSVQLLANQAGGAVLDVGCGTGIVASELSRGGTHRITIGLDASHDMLTIAAKRMKRTASHAYIVRGEGEALPFRDNSFEYVVSLLVLHHLPPDVKDAALAEMLRVLRPSGRLYVADFGVPASLIGRLLVAALRRHAHAAEQFTDGVTPLLARAGFVDVQNMATQAGVIHHLLAAKPPRGVL